MVQVLLNLIGACGHFVWDVLCALLDFGMGLLSAIASLLVWVVKLPFSWTGFLVLALFGLLAATYFERKRRF